MMANPITHYLTHEVDIVAVTMTLGSRTVSTTTGVPAFIESRRVVETDAAGEHVESDTIVWLKPTQTISEDDEILIDGMNRPIRRINRVRQKNGDIHHLEIELS